MTTELNAAEQQLLAAWKAGDDRAAAEAEATIERLDAEARARRAAVSLHSAALYYASIGLHVFPLQPGTKIPIKGSNGCLGASTDAAMVNRWWLGNPRLNIGIATGHAVDVVDIDGPVGQQSRAQHWDTVFAQVEFDHIAKVLTPRRGGMHLYVPATGDGNRAGILPGVDYRGRGGYVVAPPSVITEGNGTPGAYAFLGTPDFTHIQTQGGAA